MKRLLFFNIALLFLLAGVVWSAPQNTEMQLKSSILNVQSQLGNLEPWQKKVFLDDVLPLYQRFIKDYRPSSNGPGLLVDVDRESIRRFLKYHPNKNNPRAMALMKVDPACNKCVTSAEEIQKSYQASLERRDFVVTWITSKDLGTSVTTGKELDEKLVNFAEAKGVPVVVSVQLRVAPIDNIDTAHADEEHYQVSTFLYVKDLVKTDGHVELMSSDSFRIPSLRLLADVMTEAGSKVEVKEQTQEAAEIDEILLQINGVRSIAEFSKLKKFISNKFKDLPSTVVEQRSVSKNQAVFAILSRQPLEAVLSNLKGVYNIDPESRTRTNLGYVRTVERTIEMEIR
jgi:hypothetical protein